MTYHTITQPLCAYLDVAVAEHVLDEQDGPEFEAVDAVAGDDEEVGEAADADGGVEGRTGLLEGGVDPQGAARQQTADLRRDLAGVAWHTHQTAPVRHHLPPANSTTSPPLQRNRTEQTSRPCATLHDQHLLVFIVEQNLVELDAGGSPLRNTCDAPYGPLCENMTSSTKPEVHNKSRAAKRPSHGHSQHA